MDGDTPLDIFWEVEDAGSPEAAVDVIEKALKSGREGNMYGAMGVWDTIVTHGPSDYKKAFLSLKRIVAKAADKVMEHADFQDSESLGYLKKYMMGKPTGGLRNDITKKLHSRVVRDLSL